MQIISQLEEFKFRPDNANNSIALTLGNFDGVHLGHQALLKRVFRSAHSSVLITFSNHPGEILRGTSPPRLTSLRHKLELLSQTDIGTLHKGTVVLLPFTRELSQMSAEQFLEMIRLSIPFTHLILGHDAHFGHERDGTQKKLSELGARMGFSIEHIQPVLVDNLPISSTRIRMCIEKGDLKEASRLLGRPFSIYGEVIAGLGLGKTLGFPTANIQLEGLTLPPFGVYAVTVHYDNITAEGIANLGIAPTLSDSSSPKLEVHLPNVQTSLYGKHLLVSFKAFIRQEQKFSSLEALKNQIQQDILKTQRNFGVR